MKFSLLKKKSFILLMTAKLVSLIGTQMQDFAVSLYVLKITGSALKFSSVLIVASIPSIVLGPFAGVLVDWFDRKKIIIYLDMAAGVIVGVYAAIYKINGRLTLGSIYILVILLALISLFYNPAISTMIPSILKKDELLDGNGTNSVVTNAGNLAAPALAGVLLSFYGLFYILILNSVSFILSSICEMFISITKTSNRPDKIKFKSFVNDFTQGIKFVKSKKIIFNIIIMAVFINLFFNPVLNMGITYISKQVLKVSDFQYGNLESIFMVSMIVAPFACSLIAKRIRLGKILFLDILLTSIFMGILAVIPSPFYLNLFNNNTVPYISIIITLFIIGLVTTIGNISLSTICQQETPIPMMGRVGTLLNTVSMAAVPLGTAIFGVLFDKIPAFMCVAISSIAIFISIMFFKKSLLNCEKSEDKSEQERQIL